MDHRTGLQGTGPRGEGGILVQSLKVTVGVSCLKMTELR